MSVEVCLNRHETARICDILVDGLFHVEEVRFRTHVTAVFLFKLLQEKYEKS
jgi:hypothetical protein